MPSKLFEGRLDTIAVALLNRLLTYYDAIKNIGIVSKTDPLYRLLQIRALSRFGVNMYMAQFMSPPFSPSMKWSWKQSPHLHNYAIRKKSSLKMRTSPKLKEEFIQTPDGRGWQAVTKHINTSVTLYVLFHILVFQVGCSCPPIPQCVYQLLASTLFLGAEFLFVCLIHPPPPLSTLWGRAHFFNPSSQN